MYNWAPAIIAALAWCELPIFVFGFAGDRITRAANSLPTPMRLLFPVLFAVPYVLVALSASTLHASWLVLYLVLPVSVTALLWRAKISDPLQHGNWRDFAVLLILGLAVDLRWFEPAWPAHTAVVGKLILLDAGLYGFLAVRQLINVGLDFRLRREDVIIGLRETALYALIAVPLGLLLGFLHWHASVPRIASVIFSWVFTFLFIAVPEEVFFRGWMQNLLERRTGRNGSLFLTAAIFGLSHFNKRALHFNWRYVLLAAIAGIFYGRAWRQHHRIAACALTHATVDAVWSLWLS